MRKSRYRDGILVVLSNRVSVSVGCVYDFFNTIFILGRLVLCSEGYIRLGVSSVYVNVGLGCVLS